MPKTHEIKIWPSQFDAVVSGHKTFEWRKNDRDYAVGDTLVMREWDPAQWSPASGDWRCYTGRQISVVVTYKAEGVFGIPEGYCVLAIKKLEVEDGK